jgi:carboxylate-amine ligase
VIEHRFGESQSLTIGIEEELFVLDGKTLAPAPFPREALDGARLKEELFASVVELNTGVHSSVEAAVEELRGLRARATEIAATRGLTLAGTGTWPTAVPEEQELSPNKDMLEFAEYAGSSARRQYCSGLHVHVGVESPEACMRSLEAVLPWLPVVLAASANSPYLAGRESGLRSTRAEILSLLPRAGAPPVFGSYEEWARFAETLVQLGLAGDTRRIWWDVRPSPSFGTLEVRMPDQPTRLEATAALATAIRAMVAALEASAPADRGVYDQNRWAASRFGRDAELIHPDGSRLLRAWELLEELGGLVGREAVAPLVDLAQADEQLEVGRADGLQAVCGRLVELT